MPVITRRNLFRLAASASALSAGNLFAQQGLIKRQIPKTGESLPVIGLGSSATFSQVARTDEVEGLGSVLRTLVKNGGSVFDTAPGYGASEEVAGRLAYEEGLTNDIFWATKVNVAGRGGGSANPDAARAQIDTSFKRFHKDKVDLIQVHNLGDVPTQLGILKELKSAGRVRYIGVTTTNARQYPELIGYMKNEPLDFIGVDYAIDNRNVEEAVLPLALERKIGVLVYLPFGRTRLFSRVGNRPLPDWAAEIDAKTWAQVFLKFLVGNPAVTAVTPATSNPEHMLDNIGGGIGRVPDEALRKRMGAFVDSLPSA